MKIKLNTFSLKLIAMAAMLLDHFALLFIPSDNLLHIVFRGIGRIAAPIFFYCLAIGLRNTTNRPKYQQRLAIASIAMAVNNCIIRIFLNPSIEFGVFFPNMFFTMFMLSIAIECFDSYKKTKDVTELLLALVVSTVIILKAEYDIFALAITIIFFFIKKKPIRALLYAISTILFAIIKVYPLQIMAMLALLLIDCDTRRKPRKPWRWFFYIFYPAHLLVLSIIAYFL